LKFGEEPYLECSSRGDRRFSAFYAKVKPYKSHNFVHSIEEGYQGFKIFEDGRTGLSWKEAKGKKPVNIEECRKYYSDVWDLYFQQNPDLIDVILEYRGFSDMFGQKGHACQAEEVYRIYNASRMAREGRGCV